MKIRLCVTILVVSIFILLISVPGYSLLSIDNTSTNSTNLITSVSLSSSGSSTNLNTSINSSLSSSSDTLSNSDLTTIISLSSIYYAENDVVNIDIRNMTGTTDVGNLYMEISVLEDPTYSFRYLGLLGNQISFIPEKSGTYTIRLYSISGDNYVYVAEKSFYVYDVKTYACKNYELNSLTNIDLRFYEYYANRSLPNSLTLVYTDYNNNSEVFVYANKIEGIIEYKFAKPGRYDLFSEGQYLDCFIADNANDTSTMNNTTFGNNASEIFNPENLATSNISIDNASLVAANMLSNTTNNTTTGIVSSVSQNVSYDENQPFIDQNGLLETTILTGDKQAIYNNFYSESGSENLDFSQDKLLDIRGMSNGIVIAEVSRNNTFGLILELWAIDVNTGMVKRLAFNESAPSYKIRFGIKDDVLFWVSEFNDKVYAYDTSSNITIYHNLPSYDLSKGEIGRVSFNDTVIKNGWEVLIDGSQIYFYNQKDGEIFSDDNSDIKEEFRKKFYLDKYLSSDELSQLSFEVNQDNTDQTDINTINSTQEENIIVQ